MDVKYSDANVTLTLAPSRRLRSLVGMAAFATLSILAFTPGAPVVRLLVGGCCVALAFHAARRASAPRRIGIEGGIAIRVEERGQVRDGRIVAGSFVAPWLTIVHWRPEGALLTRTIVIVPDMVEAGRFRALRVILRWG